MDLAAGEVFTVFGPNGAGKTTMLRVLATLSRPDSGALHINGHDALGDAATARGSIGVVMHSSLLYGELTALENLRFYARMYRIPDSEDRIAAVAERMNVAHRMNDRVRELSHGLAKRVAFARALLHRPRVLLLDEPESGLDQNTLRIFEQLLDDYRSVGGSVVMVTHSIERGVALSDRIAVLGGGRFVYVGNRGSIDVPSFTAMYDSLTGEA
jgi:heme exporter protein A